MKKALTLILTLALILTIFTSCTNTDVETTTDPAIETSTEKKVTDETTTEVEETTEEEPVGETTTEEETTEKEVEETTTKTPETTTKKQETTTKEKENTTKKEETTTKKPVETTTQKKEETTTKKQETTTEAGPLKEEATPEPTSRVEEEDLSWMDGPTSKKRAGLIYDGAGRLSSYDKISEGEKYYEYDKNGNRQLKEKPYSKGNEPEPDRCKYCGKETKPYDGKHYGSYYGYCDRYMTNMNCPECGVFVKSNTCHTCKK